MGFDVVSRYIVSELSWILEHSAGVLKVWNCWGWDKLPHIWWLEMSESRGDTQKSIFLLQHLLSPAWYRWDPNVPVYHKMGLNKRTGLRAKRHAMRASKAWGETSRSCGMDWLSYEPNEGTWQVFKNISHPMRFKMKLISLQHNSALTLTNITSKIREARSTIMSVSVINDIWFWTGMVNSDLRCSQSRE